MGTYRYRSIAFSICTAAFAVFCLLANAIATGATASFDEVGRLAVRQTASPFLNRMASVISFLGRPAFLIAVTAAIVAVLLHKRRHAAARALSLAMAGAIGLNLLLKNSLHRARPHSFFATNPNSFSFPSGHVLFESCFWGAVILITVSNRRLHALSVAAGTLLIMGVSWSRVYLGVHYPTDVAAGLLVALFWIGALVGLGIFHAGGDEHQIIERR